MEKSKSVNLKTKMLIRLNDKIFQQNLPQIPESKGKQKQNRFSDIKVLLKKKANNIVNMPKRFKKHNNKIEDNMNCSNKTSIQFHSAITKTCPNSFYKGKKQNPIQQRKHTDFNKERANIQTIEPKSTKQKMQPKTLQEIQRFIERRYKKKQGQIQVKKSKLCDNYTSLIKKNRISRDITELFHQNKQSTILSRFTLLELKSYYCSILNFAQGDLRKFKYSFQIMLNLANVTVRETIMNECVRQLMVGGITFKKFLKSFTDIQERLRKQTIIDYFQILLQEIKKSQVNYEELVRTFEGRMKKQIANQLTELLYQQLQKQFTDKISKKEIHSLCYSNEQFCAGFFSLNHDNMLSNKICNFYIN